jgi:hypothetical protein
MVMLEKSPSAPLSECKKKMHTQMNLATETGSKRGCENPAARSRAAAGAATGTASGPAAGAGAASAPAGAAAAAAAVDRPPVAAEVGGGGEVPAALAAHVLAHAEVDRGVVVVP